MAIKPLSDRVVLKRVDAAETVKGGIIIPDTAKEKPMEAEVVAVGEGKINENGTRNPMSVKAGEKVLIGKYSGTEVQDRRRGPRHRARRRDPRHRRLTQLSVLSHQLSVDSRELRADSQGTSTELNHYPFRRHTWPSPSSMPKMPARRSCAA